MRIREEMTSVTRLLEKETGIENIEMKKLETGTADEIVGETIHVGEEVQIIGNIVPPRVHRLLDVDHR